MALIFSSWTFYSIIIHIVVAVAKECNVSVETEGSIITSPNFPSDYFNDASCWYVIQAPHGCVVTLVFSKFAVEKGSGSACRYDKLVVYDSTSYFEDPVHILCGYTLPASVTSTNSSLTLFFESDQLLTESGFQGQVSFRQRKDDASKCTSDAYSGTTDTNEMSSFVTTDMLASDPYTGTTVGNEMSSLRLSDIPATYRSPLIGTDIPDLNNELEFRLRSDEGVNDGRLEVFIADSWGSICGEGWDLSHAHAACKWFGYRYALEATHGIRFGVGPPPFYNIICRGDIDVLSVCSFYKTPDQQCNHWGFAGVVCFSVSPTLAVEYTSPSFKMDLHLPVIASLFALLILVPVIACIVWRKRHNGTVHRLDFLQLQNRHLPSTPKEESINIQKCVHKNESIPSKPQVNFQNASQIYTDPLYEQCETTLSMDEYCRELSRTKRIAAQSQELKDFSLGVDGSSSSDTNNYHDLSDRENSSDDFPQIEHTYGEEVIRNKDDSGEAYHTYIEEDVYESIP